MIGFAIVLAASLLTILWANTVATRRRVRKYLLANGARAQGSARLVSKRGVRHPRIHVDFTQADGTRLTAIKSVVSAGDENLVAKKVTVLYDPREPKREDRMLLGFGVVPTVWFRVRVRRGSAT